MTEDKINILFVDDEAMLLQGLRRMLRSMRGEWNMSFAEGGLEALAFLADNPVDVVVSDMRMPEMTGADLLAEVSQRYPGVIRIVLSGYAENEAVMKTIGPSHQYLAKPCNADLLIQTIKRSLNLRRSLSAPALRDFITGIQVLPVLPEAYDAFMAEIAKPGATTDSIARIVEQDIALTATVLKLTNSAYFSLPTNISDCRQAVQLLGIETMRSIVAVAGLFEPGDLPPAAATVMIRLRDEAIASGGLARGIAQAEGLSHSETDQACSAGLFSALGSLLLLLNDPERAVASYEKARLDGSDLCEVERAVFGASHAEAGAYLLSLWGFADPVIEAVLYHHDPAQAAAEDFGPVAAVHAAQAIAAAGGNPGNENDPLLLLNTSFIHGIGKEGSVAVWRELGAGIAQKGALS